MNALQKVGIREVRRTKLNIKIKAFELLENVRFEEPNLCNIKVKAFELLKYVRFEEPNLIQKSRLSNCWNM